MYRVIRGGCTGRHPSSFVISHPDGLPNYLLLIIHTCGHFQIAEHHFEVTPGQALIIAPHTPYSYGNPNGEYLNDWLHFDVKDPGYFTEKYPLTNRLFSINKTETFTSLIRQILWEASYSEPPYAEENIDSLFTVLINHLLSAYHSKSTLTEFSPYQSQLQSLHLELQNTLAEKHSIRKHARAMGISESYFQHLYSNYFGVSFQKDLINLRIEEAKYMLTTTNLTIEQIAEMCGYTNEVHFYRQFKAIAGITPSKYRKEELS